MIKDPPRVVETESGQILQVWWKCPKCEGKGCIPWKPLEGCGVCKGHGEIDGVHKAIYVEGLLRAQSHLVRPRL